MKTIERCYRVDRREIFYIQSIFEGYDGIVTMSTVDADRGVIRLSISPDAETDVFHIIEDLKSSGCIVEPAIPLK